MTDRLNRLTRLVGRLWRSDRPLTATGLVMLVALAASLVGLIVDPRQITGAPAWLKPAKFAVSVAIYTFTLAWVFTFLPTWIKTRRIVGWTTALVLLVEVAIIDVQAWRGTSSHFNVGTAMDATLFSIMGLLIMMQTLLSVAVAIALWRQPFTDKALGWALRLGMTLTLVGATTGGLMVQPTADQLAAARAGARMTVAGAHTVGAPDGGPGVPGTGWSTEHGDLRVPHFVGLHALQALPLIALALRQWRRSDGDQVRLVIVAAASYALLFGLLLWQALDGQSLVRPGATVLGALLAWAALTAVAARLATARRQPMTLHAI